MKKFEQVRVPEQYAMDETVFIAPGRIGDMLDCLQTHRERGPDGVLRPIVAGMRRYVMQEAGSGNKGLWMKAPHGMSLNRLCLQV